MEIVHYSVMKEEVCNYLKPDSKNQLLIDGTMGEGGHSEMFLSRFDDLNVIGLDADSEIQKIAKKRLDLFGDRVQFRNTWFNDYFNNYNETRRPDRILLDLGISVFHYEKSGGGFSFQKDEELDMRLNKESTVSAKVIVNEYDEKEIADLIFEYGEEKYSRRIASAICTARKEKEISSSLQLAELIKSSVPSAYKYGRIHPATRTFQAIRIAVNSELDRLDKVIVDALKILKIGGRLGIITFHSLEDRAVKRFFKEMNKSCVCPPEFPVCKCGGMKIVKLLTRKPVIPTENEISENPPSRSAKFRVIEKIEEYSDRKLVI